MVCCRYDSAPPPDSPLLPRVLVVGGGTFLPLAPLSAISGKSHLWKKEEAYPAVTALDAQMDSEGRILCICASSFAASIVIFVFFKLFIVSSASCQRVHPVLLFSLILIHDGSQSLCGPQHLG